MVIIVALGSPSSVGIQQSPRYDSSRAARDVVVAGVIATIGIHSPDSIGTPYAAMLAITADGSLLPPGSPSDLLRGVLRLSCYIVVHVPHDREPCHQPYEMHGAR